MNIRELKKIRKRFKYFWENDKFVVIDLQQQRVRRYRNICDFI
jgi:N-glycosylase/DNA lyase